MLWYSIYACSIALDIKWHIRKAGLMLCTYNVVRRSITIINFNALFVIHSIDQINSSSLSIPLNNYHKHDKHDNLYAFVFPGSDARIRIPRVRCALSHSQGPMWRWPPACPVPVTARQPMAAALGRGFTGWACAFGWRPMRLWKPVSGNPPSINTPDDHWPGPGLAS